MRQRVARELEDTRPALVHADRRFASHQIKKGMDPFEAHILRDFVRIETLRQGNKFSVSSNDIGVIAPYPACSV